MPPWASIFARSKCFSSAWNERCRLLMTWCDLPSKITGCTISASPARFDALHEYLPLSLASGTFTINSCVPSAWSNRWYFGSSGIRTQSLYHSIVGRGTPWTCVSREISLIFKWYPSTKFMKSKKMYHFMTRVMQIEYLRLRFRVNVGARSSLCSTAYTCKEQEQVISLSWLRTMSW